jgi:hypothetical protein
MPAQKSFNLVKMKNSRDQPPRQFLDYTVTIDEANKPEGVSIEVKL